MSEYDDEQDEREVRKVYWKGSQWCVTSFGLETIIDQRYYVEAELLGALTDGEDRPMAERLRHIGSTKGWVDVEDLAAAFAVALAVHSGRFTPLPEGAFLNALAYVRRVRWMNRHGSENQDHADEDWLGRLRAAGAAADVRAAEQPFELLADPHPTYEEQVRIIEAEAVAQRRAARDDDD